MATRTVGFFHSGTRGSFQKQYDAFASRLREVFRKDEVKIIERWAGDDRAKGLERHAQDLVAEGVEVIVAAGGPPSALAAQKAVAGKVPVVFMSVADPVGLELVNSLDDPGTNMTGIAGLTSELDVTRLELLREVIAGRGLARVAVLNNANRPKLEEQFRTLKAAAPGLNLGLVRRDVVDLDGIKRAMDFFKDQVVDALLVTADSLFNDLRTDVVGLVKGVPAIYQWREFVEVGGLISFGPNILDAYSLVGEYAADILDDPKASNAPVALPDSLELVLNLRVAHAEGFKIPASILSRAEIVSCP